MKKKANARIKIEYRSPRNGLKVYGKVKEIPVIQPGDSGFVELLSALSIQDNPQKPYAFWPSKWKYEWFFRASENDFEVLSEQKTP